MFYVKFPIKIVTMSFINKKVEILAITNVSNQYIPDERWTIVIGDTTVLALMPMIVAEFSLLENYSLNLLHTFWFDSDFILPPKYSRKTNTAFVQTADNVIHALWLGK